MKKRCSQCGHVLYDAASDDVRCPECGGELLVADEAQMFPQMPQQGGGMQMDNRIHKGDNIGKIHHGNEMNVGGDNAGNIDKSTTVNNTTTNTTSNTNNYNTTIVQQAKDEGSEMVECEYSGDQLRRIDTFRCKKCKRVIGRKYKVEEYNCCPDCRDKLIAAQVKAVRTFVQNQPGQPTAAAQATRKSATISVNPNQSHVPYSDTSRAGSSTNNKTKYILIGALLVAGYVGYNVLIHSDDDKAGPVAEQVEQPAEAAPTQESTEKKAASALNAGSKSNTTAAAPVVVSQSGQKAAEVKKTAQPAAAAPATSSAPSAAPAASTSNTASVATEQPAEKRELSAAELLSQGLSATKRFKPEQAATYFQQAIAKGSVEANYYLGELYYNGNGVAKSFPTARKYFEVAANAGIADAQYMMGVTSRNGQGCEKNISEAKKWLEKAVAQGHTSAGRMLNQLK